MPKIVSIAVEGSDYIGVDSQGRIWKGRMERGQAGNYVKWEQIEQEFPRHAS